MPKPRSFTGKKWMAFPSFARGEVLRPGRAAAFARATPDRHVHVVVTYAPRDLVVRIFGVRSPAAQERDAQESNTDYR